MRGRGRRLDPNQYGELTCEREGAGGAPRRERDGDVDNSLACAARPARPYDRWQFKAFARRHKPIVTRLLPAPSPAPGRVGLEPDSDLTRFENRDDIWNISSPPSSRVVVYSRTQQTVPVIQSPAHGGSESGH
ncbi:hypothetical protein EVAR_5241_1 [Eumeta japonica]|uniref:Uncharacterized protein n=1 Tax=Eumeta variegata TaxID=151549 RepID=A0A4C1XSA1_EUMVA|nr:hypothetical protein EVAR_5241_1 [Eumeta japonica]